MATDNFLDKKSVLGLASEFLCVPPETIVFADSIQWGGVSLLNKNQHQYSENISAINVSNREMIRKLAIGQSIACKIKINAEQVLTITHYYLMERVIKYRHARALTLSISQRTIFRTIILVIFVGESVWQQKSGSSRL